MQPIQQATNKNYLLRHQQVYPILQPCSLDVKIQLRIRKKVYPSSGFENKRKSFASILSFECLAPLIRKRSRKIM